MTWDSPVPVEMSRGCGCGLVLEQMSLLAPVLGRFHGFKWLFCLCREQAEGAARERERPAEPAGSGCQWERAAGAAAGAGPRPHPAGTQPWLHPFPACFPQLGINPAQQGNVWGLGRMLCRGL